MKLLKKRPLALHQPRRYFSSLDKRFKLPQGQQNLIFNAPYPLTLRLQEYLEKYKKIEVGMGPPTLEKTAGRVIGKRKSSKDLLFFDLSSHGRTLQVMLEAKHYQDQSQFRDIKAQITRGCIIGVEGSPIRTEAGELSILAKQVKLLSGCGLNLPASNRKHKTFMLSDSEARFQKRYLDFIVNNGLMDVFFTRARIIAFLRRYFEDRGFLEVETPILQPKVRNIQINQAGGALAKPFVTSSRVLGEGEHSFELRIAPELYLKQLIIGGFERVFEIGKCFRNEGLSARHNPEFTSLEFYQAYTQMADLKELTKHLLTSLVVELFGSAKIAVPQLENEEALKQYDFSTYKEFEVIPELEKAYGAGRLNLSESSEKIKQQCMALIKELNLGGQLKLEEMNSKQLLDKLIEITIESQCDGPSFILHHPSFMSPLAKPTLDNPLLADRFQFFCDKIELINSYSQINQATLQSQKFKEQKELSKQSKQDDELHEADQEFLRALSYGMPPTAGWGLGIDRLVMILCGLSNIREAILFPNFRSSLFKNKN